MLCHFVKNWTRSISTLQSTFNVFDHRTPGGANVGLFRIPELTNASGFNDLMQSTQDTCRRLVSEVTASQGGSDTNLPRRRLVNVFDELSDSLCQLADMADFVRLAHPETEFRGQANAARVLISGLVETLNTDAAIHDALKKSIDDGVCKDNEVEQRVEKLFLFDFQQSGIHLPLDDRKRFVEITELINDLSSRFMIGCHEPSLLIGRNNMPPHLRHVFNVGRSGLQVTYSRASNDPLISSTYSEHENHLVREAGYTCYYGDRSSQHILLEQLVETRLKLARLVGFRSFAEKELKGTLAGNPEYVLNFLEHVSSETLPLAKEELLDLNILKSQHTGIKSDMNIWDLPFYMQKAKQISVNDISEYLPLGNCMQGISDLFGSIFGITFEPVLVDNGEVWHEDVIKLSVRNSSHDEIGVIYCDFFERPNKPQDCHFTIRAGRRIDNSTYQNPIIAITLSLAPPIGGRPTLMTSASLENLFHEMGHAGHTMLGRTAHQHVAGTRCCTDLAEVPSVLMEYFANDARVISTFARHWKTGEPIPIDRLQLHCNSKHTFVGLEMQLQLLYSMVDQRLHGDESLSIQDVVRDIQAKHYTHPLTEGTAWYQRFSHFVGYGSKYYSYLTSRAVASQIWNQCFKEDPFSRKNGDLYREHILSHGGEIEPRILIENLLGKGSTCKLSDSLIYDILANKHNK